MRSWPVLSLLTLSLCFLNFAVAQSSSLGIFEGQSDVGSVVPPGALTYNPSASVYSIQAAGAESLVDQSMAFTLCGRRFQATSASPPT